LKPLRLLSTRQHDRIEKLSGRGSTNIQAATLSFNMVASIRGTVAVQDNRRRDELDEAIKKPEAAGTGAHIEVVTEADERLRMNEKDLPGGRAMRHLVRSRSEPQDRVTELVEQQTAISEALRAIANSPHDLQPIFDAILDSATHLCRAAIGSLRLSEESNLRLVAVRGNPLLVIQAWSSFPVLEKGSFLATSRLSTHIPDLAALEAIIGMIF
jgi:hypothetical protein